MADFRRKKEEKRKKNSVFPSMMLCERTRILQPGVSQRAAVAPVLVGQVGSGVVRTVVGRVSQRAAVGGCARGEGPVVLRGPHGVQTVVVVVRQAGGGLLVRGVSGITVTTELQKRRFGRIRRD